MGWSFYTGPWQRQDADVWLLGRQVGTVAL